MAENTFGQQFGDGLLAEAIIPDDSPMVATPLVPTGSTDVVFDRWAPVVSRRRCAAPQPTELRLVLGFGVGSAYLGDLRGSGAGYANVGS